MVYLPTGTGGAGGGGRTKQRIYSYSFYSLHYIVLGVASRERVGKGMW